MKPGPRPVPVELRFWNKVDKNGPLFNGEPCWLWTAARSSEGYGRIAVNRISSYAHRVAYEMEVGPVPDGLQLDHLCRNRVCVNPAHLEPVTTGENTRRGDGPTVTRERGFALTHCAQGHEFTPDNTYTVPGLGWRRCRICVRAWRRKRYEKERSR